MRRPTVLRRRPAPSTVAVTVATLVLTVLTACGGGGGGGGGNSDDDPVIASSSGDAPRSGEAPVRIANFEFKPKTVTVRPGTTVTWTNEDASIHDVKDTSPLATPPSPPMSQGDTFSITYAEPGTYSYVCGIHPYMTGTVEVVP